MIRNHTTGPSGGWKVFTEDRLAAGMDQSGMPNTDADAVTILHELLVHQVELEMQNEELREARDVLEENSGRFKELYDFAPVGYFSLAADGSIRQLNLTGARMLGGARERLVGGKLADFVSPENRECIGRLLEDLFAGREAETCEVALHHDAEPPVILILMGLLSPNGMVCRIAAMDISGRRQAEDSLRVSEEKFRSIFDSSPLAMYCYLLEEDGRLVLMGANAAADRETGIEHGELIGLTVEEAFPALAGTATPALFKAVARGELGTQSFVIRYDDTRIAGSFEVKVFQTSRNTIVVAFTDISERMRIEDSLKKAQDELELQVQRRTAQLEERTLQLRALASELTLAEDRERRRIAGLIHDHLQQMLVAALLNLGMLKSKAGNDDLVAELANIEGVLRDSIETTRSLTTELSPSVLYQCGLGAALNWLRPWSMDKFGLEVEVDADESIECGRDLSVTLFRCVRELLFNIVKHSGVKSAAIHMWRPASHSVRIEVSDEGAGFDPELARAREGLTGGFGLFNIRERLELLGGGLEIESSPGLGSRFILWVPLAAVPDVDNREETTPLRAGKPATAGKSPEPVCGGPPARKIRIVVADDHDAVREGLVRVFEKEPDLEVVGQAVDGEEALQLARELRPHFVVMDMNMPRMDGLEATTSIRGELPCVRVLGLSTHADGGHRAAMMRAGAVDLLHKNLAASEIVSALRDHSMLAGCPDRAARVFTD